jgi:hypothetical protein
MSRLLFQASKRSEHCKVEKAKAAHTRSAAATQAYAKFAYAVKRRRRRLKIKLPWSMKTPKAPEAGIRRPLALLLTDRRAGGNRNMAPESAAPRRSGQKKLEETLI